MDIEGVDGMGDNSQKSKKKFSKCACSWGCGVTTQTFFIAISTSRCVPIVMGNTMHVLKQQIINNNVVSKIDLF